MKILVYTIHHVLHIARSISIILPNRKYSLEIPGRQRDKEKMSVIIIKQSTDGSLIVTSDDEMPV